MKKKIAVCIPSFNESHIIATTLLKVDLGLKKYINWKYDVIIVNVDNNSPDNTSEIFMSTNTICPKISIKTNEMGKGTNLLKFFEYCYNNNIDYAIIIDADVKSMNPDWISKFLDPLIKENYDYVTPIYRRSRYEGSTTNHFAFPLIYAITGILIRQPIAGDFSFNRNFIEMIVKQPITDSIKRYGIDIFMTLTACCKKLNVFQISLNKKIHNPSYNKMEGMFQEVLDSFLFTWLTILKEGYQVDLCEPPKKEYFCKSIICSRKFNHKIDAQKMLDLYLSKIRPNEDIEDLWLKQLKKLVLNPETIDEKGKKEIFYIFMVRAIKFWFKSEKWSASISEYKIVKQADNLYRNIRNKEEK